MANPEVVTLPEYTWVKVATSTRGIHVTRVNSTVLYYKTYRNTEDTSPDPIVGGVLPQEAIRIFELSNEEFIKSSDAIDVYLICVNKHRTATADVGYVVVGPLFESVDVVPQDQTTPQVNLYMNRELSTFTLSGIQTVGSYILNVVAGHTAVAGDYVCIQETDEERRLLRFYQARVVVSNATTLEMSRPIDYAFDPAKVNCSRITRVNMAGEVGTIGAPIIYKIQPTYGKWHIYQMHVKMFSPSGTFDDGTFGPLTALVHGLTVLKRNGFVYNIFNFRSNGEILGFAEGSPGYSPKPPAGTGSGLTATISFVDGNGSVPEIEAVTGGALEIWLPDSLAAWPVGGSLEFKVEGHIVTP